MIYFSAAMYCEAAPLVEKYNMKKMTEVSQFQIFRSHEAALVISGIGGTSAAIAVTFLLTFFKATEKDYFVNIGVCGAARHDFKEGDLVLCNKIINSPMGKIFFPDMLVTHPFREAALVTCAKPADSMEAVEDKAPLADMEGAFAYEAASKFIPPHKIFTVKVVSDMCRPETVTAEKVRKLMYETAEIFIPWLEQVKGFFSGEDREVLSQEELDFIISICKNLKMSQSMSSDFKKLAAQYKIRCGGLKDQLEPYMTIEVNSRAEGKKYFSEIRDILTERDL